MTLLSLDSKRRIALGKLLKGRSIEHFEGEILPTGEILLHPMSVVPVRERWLHENPKTLASVRRGLDQSAKGKTRKLGSFAKYAKE